MEMKKGLALRAPECKYGGMTTNKEKTYKIIADDYIVCKATYWVKARNAAEAKIKFKNQDWFDLASEDVGSSTFDKSVIRKITKEGQ